MNNTSVDGLAEIAPANVMALFTSADLTMPDAFLDALQNRFLNAQLKPQRLDPIHNFLKTKSPIEESDIRKSIRLVMCTPEYQLT
jgi:hypothetical protein